MMTSFIGHSLNGFEVIQLFIERGEAQKPPLSEQG